MAELNWTAEQISQALGGKPTGNGFIATCPSHDDKTPSLSIWQTAKGPAWKCQAGCEWKSVTQALESKIPDAFPRKKPRAEIVVAYDYTDAKGSLLGQVVRFKPKTFRQRKPKPEGGWSWKMEGLQLPLYRLPEIAPLHAIFVVEGEKDADAMWDLGLPATTSPGGAGKWRDIHSLAMTGKRVCIIADKDKPGRAHGAGISAAIKGVSEYACIIEVPDPHKDASDWIKGGATKQNFIDAAKNGAANSRTATPPVETQEAQNQPLKPSTDSKAPIPTATPEIIEPIWQNGLIYNDQDGVRLLLANAIHAITHAPSISGLARFDEFQHRMIVSRETPWSAKVGDRWTDRDDTYLTEWLQHNEIRVGDSIVHTAALAVAQSNPFDSLQEYLTGLRWDQKPRLRSLARYFGNTSELAADIMRLFAISAVARAMQPGCQADHLIVLEGRQGMGKSTALRILFDPLGQGWFRDHLESIDSKDSAQQLVGNWATEIAELDGISSRRVDLEKVKSFLSRRIDSYRPSYGRHVVDIPRRNIFAGSTNDAAYLRDTTGNRRFWPMPTGDAIDIKGLLADVNQIWAEAMVEFERGEQWWQISDDEALVELQLEKRTVDPWYVIVDEFCSRYPQVTMDLIFHDCLKMDADKRSQIDSNRIARILKEIGWEKKRIRDGYRIYWGYIRMDSDKTISPIEQNEIPYDA